MSASASETTRLLYFVKNDSLCVKLRPSQMTVKTIGKVFNLLSGTIFLVGEDGSVATPDEEDGSFNTFEMNCDVIWNVSGSPSVNRGNHASCSYSLPSRQQVKPSKWRPSSASSVIASW